MKVGIVGMGTVGRSSAIAIALRTQVQELVLVNRNRAVAKGVATDMRYGLPPWSRIRVADGDYTGLAGAQLVVLTAGVNEKTGGATDRNDPLGRLRLLAPNAQVYEEVVPRIAAAAPEAPILVVTDPPEPLTDVARRLAGHERVFGAGTMIDSLRLRVHIAARLGVSPASVHAYVVGEHGTSSVFLWSSARIGGARLGEILAQRRLAFDDFRRAVEQDVRYANIAIIEGIGASQYGIGMVVARMVEAVLGDEHAVFAVGSYQGRYGATLSLPSVLARDGVSEVLAPEMSADEVQALERGAEKLRRALAEL
jgi:L-lactate dehydrogenase